MSLTTGTRAGEIELNQDSGQRHRKDVGELKAGPNSQLGNGIRKSLSAVGGDYYLPPPRDIYTPGGTAEQRWQWGGCQCPPPRPFGGFDARPAIPGGTTGFDVQEFVSQQAPAINSVAQASLDPSSQIEEALAL
ncbi:hypothetical protein AAG570_010926 [Ranatra chinensis]|uniref:Uncharacterized protein n=1 Tax=Ranatra chinensis TaxID=642074 RepID=A0ABD0Z1C8_9HEMI